MDFSNLDPSMMQNMQSMLMRDPELVALMQQPGVMEKMMAMYSDPSRMEEYMQDPQVSTLMARFQGMMGGGGSGGMGGMGGMSGMGGMGGFGGMGGGFPSSSSTSSSSSSSSSSGSSPVITITSATQYHQQIAAAGPKLVVIDFFQVWCKPCKLLAPTFDELANTFRGKAVFLKVEGDRNPDLLSQLGVESFPTVWFLRNGTKVDSFVGAQSDALRTIVTRSVEDDEIAANACPYKHFPVKDNEVVKYADMKWEPVEQKLAEYNDKLQSEQSACALSGEQMTQLKALIVQMQGKNLNATFGEAQYALVHQLLTWPAECVGPVLNVARMLALWPAASPFLAKQVKDETAKKSDFVSRLCAILSSMDKHVPALLAVRSIANLFNRRVTMRAMSARYEEVIDAVLGAFQKFTDDNLRTSCLTVFINFSILFIEDAKAYEEGKVQLLSSILEVLGHDNLNAKQAYTALVVLGTLAYRDETTRSMANDLELPSAVARIATQFQEDKLTREAAHEVTTVLATPVVKP